MKKSVLMGLGVLVVIGVLAFIFIPKDKLQEINLPFNSSNENKNNSGESKYIGYGSTSDYKNGYFYIKDLSHIMYFDYDTKKEVYLCNKPNCKHDDESCSSYLGEASTDELFYYNNHLYLIESSSGGVSFSITGDGTVQETSSNNSGAIYRMDLDGTNKEKVFVSPSGTSFSMPFVIKGNMMYAFFEKSKVEKDGGYNVVKTSDRKMVAINLDTGKHEEIMDGMHKSFIGVLEDKLVVEDIDYLKDPDSFDNDTNGFINNLYNSKTKIKLVDMNTKKEETVYEGLFKEIETLKFYKDGIYFIGEKSKNLEYINLLTKNRETIKELPSTGYDISTIVDDKVLVLKYKDKDAHLGDAYSIDVKTKEMNKFSLKDKNEYMVEILSSNDEYYFVQIESIFGAEYTTWAGTKQQDIIGTNYGLIKKSDYWASKPNYIKMTNAK